MTESTDSVFLKRAPHHQDALNALGNNIRKHFDEMRLFSTETEITLEEYVRTHETEIVEATEVGFVEFQKLESIRSPGHDHAHLMDVLASALRIFDEYHDLSKSEKLEIIYACLSHDLGRAIEDELLLVDKKKTEFIAPAIIGRRLLRAAHLELPQDMQTRIIYDIASAPIPQTLHRTADTVHQCDREQLIGSATISRGLAFDSILKGREIPIRLDPTLRLKLPVPESPEDTNWLIQYEFLMRNVYPPTSPEGSAAGDRIKEENCVILMLGLEGKDEEYKQVFGPELGLITTADNPAPNKRPIPRVVFENAQKEKAEFLKDLQTQTYVPGSEVERALALLEIENIFLPKNAAAVLQERLVQCSALERKNFWMILEYTKRQLHERRIKSLESLKHVVIDGDAISKMAARWVVEELGERERKFSLTHI